MVSERDAFLVAIRANPDDNTCRLVYSDWLEERGEADYANFIRAQIERDPVSENWFGVDRSRLRDDDLTPGSPSLQLNLPFRHAYQRGFISEIECGLTEYLEYADRLAPYVVSISLNLIRGPGDLPHPDEIVSRALGTQRNPIRPNQTPWLDEQFKKLAKCPWLSTWEGLDIHGFGTDRLAFVRLVSSKSLTRLKFLHAPKNELADWCIAIDQKRYSSLRSIDLSENSSPTHGHPGNDVFKVFLESDNFRQLEELYFRFNDLSAGGLQSDRHPPACEQLRLLDLSMNPIGDAGVRAITSLQLPRLEDLRLRGCRGVTADSILALASSNLMSQLTILDVSHCVIGDVGLRAIATTPRASSLRYLFADKTRAQEKSLRELIRSPHLQGLRGLHVGGVDLDPDTIDLLASQRILPQLHELSVTIPDTLPNRSELISQLTRRFGSNLFVEPGPNRS